MTLWYDGEGKPEIWECLYLHPDYTECNESVWLVPGTGEDA